MRFILIVVMALVFAIPSMAQTDTPTPTPTNTPAPTEIVFPTDTPQPTWLWVTPTPRPVVTPPFVFLDGNDIENVVYDFTDDMVAGYNSVRDVMDVAVGFMITAIVVVMFISIMRGIKRL